MLRHQLQLQAPPTTSDGMGGQSGDWTAVGGLRPALVVPDTGREREFAGQVEDSQTGKVYLRYDAAVTAKRRFLFGARLLNIRAAINFEERSQWLVCAYEEGVGQ
jgi:SPP1 family predicted phage head-tail adaptor